MLPSAARIRCVWKEEGLAPLVALGGDEPRAVRFDALLYGIELAYLAGEKYARSDLLKKVRRIAGIANIPAIQAQPELIDRILRIDHLDSTDMYDFKSVRKRLQGLVKCIPYYSDSCTANFDGKVLSTDWKASELESDDLKNYKAKAEFYVRGHRDEAVIAKLRGNVPLTAEDVEALEKILWSEVGTGQDYESEVGAKPLGEFVREIVGLDMRAAKEAFSEYLNDASLDSRQIYFVIRIVEYIVRNGMMKDLSVLREAPFTDQGSVVEIFTDLTLWLGIRGVIERINQNAAGAAGTKGA